jgi:hypothetical protein
MSFSSTVFFSLRVIPAPGASAGASVAATTATAATAATAAAPGCGAVVFTVPDITKVAAAASPTKVSALSASVHLHTAAGVVFRAPHFAHRNLAARARPGEGVVEGVGEGIGGGDGDGAAYKGDASSLLGVLVVPLMVAPLPLPASANAPRSLLAAHA